MFNSLMILEVCHAQWRWECFPLNCQHFHLFPRQGLCVWLVLLTLLVDKYPRKRNPELAHQKGTVFHQVNASSQTFLRTQQKLVQLCWDVLLHLLYSTGPCTFGLPPISIPTWILLTGRTLILWTPVKSLDRFIIQKDDKFWGKGIMMLAKCRRTKWHICGFVYHISYMALSIQPTICS